MLAWLVATAFADEPVKPQFFAGSYGRVQASSDLAGGGGDAVNVVSHGPRLELDPYMELDLGWRAELETGATFTVLVTPALSGDLFHYDGQWGDDLALRNLYVEADRFAPAPVSVWAGSRMYRGDDVYLLDFWPLDNLNTYGGGARVYPGRSELAVHVGTNRLVADDYQLQRVVVAVPDRVTGEEVLFLDRQRTIGSVRLGHELPVGDITLRARLYAELHALPEGEQLADDAFGELEVELLPSDRGSVVGAQLSVWGWGRQSFVHLWYRRATGLASYGELSVPVDGLALDLRAAKARSHMVAIAGNTEHGPVGVMAAGYLSYVLDADGLVYDFDDRFELVGVVRPSVYLTDHVAVSAEASHQFVRPNGLNPRTDEFDRPNVTKLSILPGVQAGKGGYTRPRIQLVYTATLLDDDARDFFSPFDARLSDGVQHFVGLGAEWWLNSQRTITPN